MSKPCCLFTQGCSRNFINFSSQNPSEAQLYRRGTSSQCLGPRPGCQVGHTQSRATCAGAGGTPSHVAPLSPTCQWDPALCCPPQAGPKARTSVPALQPQAQAHPGWPLLSRTAHHLTCPAGRLSVSWGHPSPVPAGKDDPSELGQRLQVGKVALRFQPLALT